MTLSPKFLHFVFLAAALTLGACGEKSSSTTDLPEGQIVNFYAELLVLRKEAYLTKADSGQTMLRTDSLYEAFHLTSDQVERILDECRENATRWKEFHEKVAERLEQLGQVQLLPKRN